MIRSILSSLDKGLLSCVVGYLCFVLPMATQAEDWFTSNQINGFASQGWVKTSDNNFFGSSERSTGSFKFTETGITGSTQIMPRVRASGQLLFRIAGEAYPGDINVDFAHIDWDVYISDDNTTTLMLGRIKSPFGLYNDTRDVAFTRPGIFLPQNIYFDNLRNTILSGDGIHLASRFKLDSGYFDIRLGLINLALDNNVTDTFLGGGFNGDFESDHAIPLARILYDNIDLGLRFSLSMADYTFNYHPSSKDPIGLGNGKIHAQYWIASAQYSTDLWSITAEYMNEPFNRENFTLADLNDFDHTVEGWFVQLDYRPMPKWEYFVRFERGYINQKDHDGSQTSLTNLPNPNAFHKSGVFGVRWDASSQWMLRAEYHVIDGTMSLSYADNSSFPKRRQHWNMFALEAAFRF